MICSDLVMSSACVALAVSGIWGDIPIWLIFIVLFIRSIGNEMCIRDSARSGT